MDASIFGYIFSAYIFDYFSAFFIKYAPIFWLAQLFQAFRFKIVYWSNDYISYFMNIINIVWTL